jgi:PAS domain S-box-containing protein
MQTIELDFEQAKTRHLLFKTRLKSILYGAEIDEQPVISHLDCAVGKWIYGHALKEYGHIPEMQQLERVHTSIHESAKELIRLYKEGKIDEARRGLSSIELIADNLVALLTVIEMKVKLSNHPSVTLDKNDELLSINYKELLELHNTIRDLDAHIRKQTDELSSSQRNVEKKLRNHFSHAPVAICILRGRDFIIELANDLYLQHVDKKADIVGKQLFDILPELEGQGIREMLNEVMNSGMLFTGNDIEVILIRNGIKETAYFDFVYKLLDDHEETPGIMIVCSEVTAQVIAKKTLIENQQRLNIVIEATALGTYELNIKFDIITFSARYLEIFGFSVEQNPSHIDMLNSIHPDDLYIRDEAYKSSTKTGVLSYEIRIIWGDNTIHWIKAMGKVFFDEANIPEKVMGTVMDITESKTAEDKILKANEALELAMKAGNLGSYELNLETGEANFNETSKGHFGFPLNIHVTIDDIRSVTHPEDRDAIKSKMQLALGNKEIYAAEYRIITKENHIRWISTSGKGIYDKKGTLIKLVGVIENITDRKHAVDELNLSVQKFRLLADSMPQFIWTGDPSGNLNYFNQSVFDYTGLSPAQIYLEGWLQIVHPDDREENIAKWMHAVQTGEDFLYEHRFHKHTGEYRWQLSRAIPQRNKAGEIQMWVGTSTDIQDQKTMAQYLEGLVKERTKELKNANIELESMNLELRSFTYISSHDLQEPLRKIQTFVSRIQETDGDTLSKDGVNYFNRIQQSANKMKTLINDLLTYSRASATEKIFETTNLNLLLQEIKTDLTDSLKEKSGTLEIASIPEMNAIPFQLRQLFINLISNAIKFAKPSTPPIIKISSSLLLGKDTGNINAHENELYHQIIVSDNGIGFDAAYKDKIFDVFQRLHPKNEYEGTGIGLSICNKIVQNHNGFITAYAEPNKGAAFTIYLPVRYFNITNTFSSFQNSL